MNDPSVKRVSAWTRKFTAAFSGLGWALKTQNSFGVHVPVAVAVMVIGWGVGLQPWRWAAIVMSIAIVLSAELLNTSIECLVAKLHPEQDAQIGQALDTAAAAVLVVSMGSAVVGLIVLVPPLIEWWTSVS